MAQCREEPMDQISRTVQEYLVAVARLRVGQAPVPLSQLASELQVSPVSVNEMCRRLQDQDLAEYRPYKGVSLTEHGERIATYIIRRHRLWEVFLVERLGLDMDQAHTSACGLEHETSQEVAARLSAFLGNPRVNPQGLPIPAFDQESTASTGVPLDTMEAGTTAAVLAIDADEETRELLATQGLHPGSRLNIMTRTGSTLLVHTEHGSLSLSTQMAADIIAVVEQDQEDEQLKSEPEQVLPLASLEPGQSGLVLRVNGRGPAARRIIEMGFSSGAEVKVLKRAPLGGPVEYEVRGYHVSLRRSEAEAVIVELSE